ncbi:M48 family metalloprotease [Streptomyces thermolilacinus]|uniref:Uncharacterized protein n=1 Tax=Streptomyces thermolilacinus SPC6 TaxID=1306406 RepID=A0A1D3DSM7_9ACTN|nr:hypothetical protein [Streptomyces thermolilacinus]OEJ95322.1 hypothetical protein J116_013390 [Streptomyces thermolilacinus SPC6]
MGEERGARAARAHALAVLRVRGRALGVALLPAAVAVVLLTGGVTGQLEGPAWDAARWVVSGAALAVLLAAAVVGAVVARARPALTPTVEIAESSAPDLYGMVRDLAARLAVPEPSAIALTPDCDSWLEDRTHPAHRISGGAHGTAGAAPVLVIGSPFLWWMRVGELRAVLAPVVAGTGPSAHPDIAAARRFVRGLDAAVALPGRPGLGPVRRLVARAVAGAARTMLRGVREHAAEMERGVAAAASERAQAVDYGLRIVAQEQVGLAYAGWDRLLTRVALPAWRMGRWPSRLDAGVVSALTELSRRDRLAEGFASRLGERPACDLLEEPGLVDEATSLLAARLFHGGPAEPGPGWAPVDWQRYPEEVVDRKWRTEAARLHRVLDRLGARAAPEGPTLTRVLDHFATADGETVAAALSAELSRESRESREESTPHGAAARESEDDRRTAYGSKGAGDSQGIGSLWSGESTGADGSGASENPGSGASQGPGGSGAAGPVVPTAAFEPAAGPLPAPGADAAPEAEAPAGPVPAIWGADELPLLPLQPPRTGRELLADHVLAVVCCAAVDTAGAAPGLDWLDGPVLLVGDGDGADRRRADVAPGVLALIEDADPEPLRSWLASVGARPEKPVRLA